MCRGPQSFQTLRFGCPTLRGPNPEEYRSIPPFRRSYGWKLVIESLELDTFSCLWPFWLPGIYHYYNDHLALLLLRLQPLFLSTFVPGIINALVTPESILRLRR